MTFREFIHAGFELLGRRPNHAAVGRQMTQVVARLEHLGGSTEQEFLHMGERLQEIVTRTGQERTKLAGLLDSMGAAGTETLAGVLDGVTHWGAQTGSAVAAGDHFDNLLPIVKAVNDPLRELRNAVRTLRVMGVITRMESARIGAQAAGFEALAADVMSLADTIEEKSSVPSARK